MISKVIQMLKVGWEKYVALCAKAYLGIYGRIKGLGDLTPAIRSQSRFRGTLIVTVLFGLVIVGAVTDDDDENCSAEESAYATECEGEFEAEAKPTIPGLIKLPSYVTYDSFSAAANPKNKPVKGKGFLYSGLGFNVVKSFPKDHAVLVAPSSDGAVNNLIAVMSGNADMIDDGEAAWTYVEDVEDDYAEGDRLEKGIYIYRGVKTIETALDDLTVRAFAKVPQKEGDRIIEAIGHNRQLMNAERERKAAERERQEAELRRKAHEAEQRKYEADAAEYLKNIDFDLTKKICFPQSISHLVESVFLKEKDASRLADIMAAQRNRDWKRLFNLCTGYREFCECDQLRSEMEVRYFNDPVTLCVRFKDKINSSDYNAYPILMTGQKVCGKEVDCGRDEFTVEMSVVRGLNGIVFCKYNGACDKLLKSRSRSSENADRNELLKLCRELQGKE